LNKYEKELNKENIHIISGVDEAGRGPLVGPVVAAAVVLPPYYENDLINDSKKLSIKKRKEIYEIIKKDALSIGIGIASAKEIDEINILGATKKAMLDAIEDLEMVPEHILIDAVKLETNIPNTSIIKGDAKSISIAAASIVAKVTRDEFMDRLHEMYPEYGFINHKGYPTKMHLDNIKKYGLLDNYRFTFKPVQNLISGDEDFETKIRKANI